jgi:putative ABC transport system permease protein
MSRKPPFVATKLLRTIVHIHYLEEVEGDLEETFNINATNKGVFRAQLLYWMHVLRAIKIYPVKRSPSNLLHEIKHFLFLTLAFRNIWKRKGTHLINAIGLSAALVSFIVILQFTNYEKSYDKFHEYGDRIVRVGFDWGELNEHGENKSIYASNVPAMGRLLEAEIPEIETQTTFVPVLTIKRSCHIRNPQTDITIRAENGFYADERFLSVFSFPAKVGSSKAFTEPNTVVLTSSFARKLYGDEIETALGKSLTILTDKEENFVVAAILDDVPSNSHFTFDYLISYATINSPRLQQNIYWSQFYCYVLLRKESSVANVTSKLLDLTKKVYGNDTRASIFLQRLHDIHLRSKLREELKTPGSESIVKLLMVVAYVVLLLGWANFTNLFLALSVERIREVGVKKILGSTRIHLIIQFLSESAIVNILSCLLGVLCFLLVSPYLTTWIGFNTGNDAIYPDLFTAIVVFIVLGSLLTGALPAWVLSSYKPLKAMQRQIHELPFYSRIKQTLLYFQFTVCFVVLASAWIMKRQLVFMQDADLGMSLGQAIAIKLPPITDETTRQLLESFKQDIRQYPVVDQITSSSSIPGNRIIFSGGVQRTSGEKLEGNNVLNVYTDENFVKTFKIEMLAGKNFESTMSDTIPHVLLNEAAVDELYFKSKEEAIGEVILWQNNKVYIAGVFANYNHLFLREAFEPMMLTQARMRHQFISVKFKDNNYRLTNSEMLSLIKDAWTNKMSNIPFDYVYLEDYYGRQYKAIQTEQKVIQNFAALALIICGIGLFSVTALMIRNRLKEIAIRKVLGARSENVISLLLTDKVSLVFLCSVIGSVVTLLVMDSWLKNFAFTVHLDLLDFLLPLLIIVGVIVISIGYHAFKAARIEPATILKNE